MNVNTKFVSGSMKSISESTHFVKGVNDMNQSEYSYSGSQSMMLPLHQALQTQS